MNNENKYANCECNTVIGTFGSKLVKSIVTAKNKIIAHKKGVIPDNADETWLGSLPSCTMIQFRRFLDDGGSPLFVLAQNSTAFAPIWLLLVFDKNEQLFRVTTGTNLVVRRLESIRQVYQVARNCGFENLAIPVEQRI